MSFRQIVRKIKKALKSLPEITTKSTNTLVGKIQGEQIVEVAGVRYRKIKLRIVDNTTIDTESQLEWLSDLLAKKQHVIEVLIEHNELKKTKITHLQTELNNHKNKYHSLQLKWDREKELIVNEMNEKQDNYISLQKQYLHQIDELTNKLNSRTTFQYFPLFMEAENNSLKINNKILTDKLSEKVKTKSPDNWRLIKEDFETTIIAQLKTIGILEAKLSGTDSVCDNDILTGKQTKAFNFKRGRSVTIKDMEIKITERNNNIKDLHIQNTLLRVQIASEQKAKDKEIGELHLQIKNQQERLDELAKTLLHEYEVEC